MILMTTECLGGQLFLTEVQNVHRHLLMQEQEWEEDITLYLVQVGEIVVGIGTDLKIKITIPQTTDHKYVRIKVKAEVYCYGTPQGTGDDSYCKIGVSSNGTSLTTQIAWARMNGFLEQDWQDATFDLNLTQQDHFWLFHDLENEHNEYIYGNHNFVWNMYIESIVFADSLADLDTNNFNEAQQLRDKMDSIKWGYMGAKGSNQSYTDGNLGVACKTPWETFRDVLARECGWDTTSANLDGWSSLVSDRASDNWSVQAAFVKPEPVKDFINKCSREGCFVLKCDLTEMKLAMLKVKGKFIYVKHNYGASYDFGLTSDDIMENISWNTTGFQNLKTKRHISYNKDFATNKLQDQLDIENTGVRTKWKIQAKENIEDMKLEILRDTIALDDGSGGPPYKVASNPANANRGFVNYYDNINGDIKILAKCSVINPLYFDIEVGDTVLFKEQYQELGQPFGKPWEHYLFMVTKTKRKLNQLDLELREVYKRESYAFPDEEGFVASGEDLVGSELNFSFD